MQTGLLLDAQGTEILVPRVQRTTHAWERMRGLLARPPLPQGAALWLVPCNSVHTLFMRYPIDTIFLDRELRILHVVTALAPWRAAARWSAHSTLELAAGGAAACGLRAGRALRWQAGH